MMKKILVMEPNPFHGEVVPGIVHYLKQLEYTVTVLVRHELVNEGIKDILPVGCEVIEFSDETIASILCDENVSEYDYLFMTSYEYLEDGSLFPFLNKFPDGVKTKYGVIGIYHSNYLINLFDDRARMGEGRIFCLSDYQRLSDRMHRIVPQYFGDYYKVKDKKDHVDIAMVGNMYDSKTLSEAYFALPSAYKRKLRFYHVGGNGRGKCSAKIQIIKKMILKLLTIFNRSYKEKVFDKTVIHTGRLKFPEMLDILAKMDYILFPIDTHSYKGTHYLSVSTSGSRQLALGLGVPTIINADVAKLYGFSDKDSIIYKDGDMKSALVTAVNCSRYNDMCDHMNKKSQQVEKESIEILSNVLESLMAI